MPRGRSSRRGLKICCGITTVLLTILVIVSITLYFTIFKPKQPQINAHPVSLEKLHFQIFPLSLNATIGLVVTIDNRNYGGFRFKNTTSIVNYHGLTVAEVPIEKENVPARAKRNISTYANIMADKLLLSPYFWNDLRTGCFNLTSTTTLRGKAIVFKVLKMEATVFSTCDISVFIKSQNVESKCNSKVKL